MRRPFYPCLSLLMVTSFSLTAAFPQAAPSKKQVATGPDNALLQKLWDGWGSLDPAKTASFYAKDPGNVYFDLAPLKYSGWAEYEKGVVSVLAEYSSGKFKVNKDVRIHRSGNLAWVTATIDAELVKKTGGKDSMVARWTAIWEKRGYDWLITHEHISVPLAPPSPSPAPTKKK